MVSPCSSPTQWPSGCLPGQQTTPRTVHCRCDGRGVSRIVPSSIREVAPALRQNGLCSVHGIPFRSLHLQKVILIES